MNRKVKCPLCNNTNLALLTDSVRFGNKADIYRCAGCGLVFLDQSSFNFNKDFYEKEYHQTYITHIEPDAFNPQLYYEKMKRTTKVWADKFGDILKGDEVVLDIGCSTGHFIELVKDKTKAIYGHELNLKEVDFCKNVLKLDVSNRPLKDRFREKTFDYITMIYVLEHIAEPKEFLISVKKLLKPNGKLIILVPNAQDALVNLYDIPEFKNFIIALNIFFYYSPETIKRLFDSVGLEGSIEVMQEYPIANHLNWAYRRAPSDTIASRRGMPDIPLKEPSPIGEWDKLWGRFNQLYKDFLRENGFGDRIWCNVGIKAG